MVKIRTRENMDIYILVPKKPLPSPDQPEESSDSYFRS
ncbi:hypothetical protein BM51_1073 [Streptococcus pneumoniae]|uniref:Uncharacterized protein n=1 Tax=Streptococcus pneumoniae serotype 4 (strain ATCC BAA-334 / TIGR4) TaxID=170187 RepID=A0A0H2UN10_STRPN|nr:hypothetical protein SP_0093 [Streptococcus pneumoniae TIGR4]EHE06548.1 hypothetical protein SPAR43_0071 [Streptococcus pneumoniae GA17227]EHE17701.1 hypothetical protein SPAR56_0093 [Streptococcus pneumoniae GA19077]KGI31124.1 hypothetical protein BM51_1073 [Streptococcus pneumoniae]KGI36149.1 hypothetical protein X231_0250 [Streptococcus pneumoniae ECC_3510]